jgi:endoglucanase
MYVIIDWHILSDSSPAMHQTEALAFFEEMSRKYAGYDNVLYEICNEPQNSPFVSVIRPYAQAVLQVIRANDPDAVVLCGTNTWSQDVDEVIGNRLEDPNVMYTLHFYAGTHKDNIRSKLQKALDAGIPVFVSECSICDASGNGGIDYDSANAWLNLLNENQVSYMAWSLSNKNETSALIRADCSLTSGWKEADLSETGQWFRKAMRQA